MDIFKIQSDKKNLALIAKFSDQLPNYVIGDEVRIRQILINIIGNAIKFTDQGKIQFYCEISSNNDAPNIQIKFMISDTGVGISPEQQNKIFDAFMQADNSSTRAHGGTGLGLAISKRLVDLLGGDLKLISQQNQGGEFSFILPLQITKNLDNKTINAEVINQPSKTIKVLLAEDNRINQLVARKMLEELDCQINIVENGELAINAVKENQYDIILMDFHMPVMDGINSAKIIRDNHLIPPETPIIAVTADVQKGIEEICKRVGMNDYLSKPFKLEQLQGMLSKWAKT
jgi:CheY-like chemotaxis protein